MRLFYIETNNLRCSIQQFVAYLLRQPGVSDAWVEPGHRTLVAVSGPTTRQIGVFLQSRFQPGRGSAIIVRKNGRRVALLRFNPRANRRWKRLLS
jgi:hypothetical protein